ncbi:unnamed protein product [Soboliphyme baturini]|uniref:phenylalanine--tRNA ligase n=1 Tax=Soboliphyme baturini TaxID=241478 RepID=A0A183IV58_9BILA|nr:unnamed protein product [Soboliphyme baturini]
MFFSGLRRCILNYAFYCTVSATLKSKPIRPTSVNVLEREYFTDKTYNIPPWILSLIGRNLLSVDGSPLRLLKLKIQDFIDKVYLDDDNKPVFKFFENTNPVVSTKQNFDNLLIPRNHPCRALSDTYYISSEYLLRTHTSAHQCELIASGYDQFLIAGDVYRRDQIDRNHFPCFHQLEGVYLTKVPELRRLLSNRLRQSAADTILPVENPPKQECHSDDCYHLLQQHLKQCLEGLVRHLFGDDIVFRWISSYFPFTYPSWEIEIFHRDSWLEILGCGIVQQQILVNAQFPDKVGWAFGLGLERLAMVLYGIPDIRLFWSTDSGFSSQFVGLDFRKSYKYKVGITISDLCSVVRFEFYIQLCQYFAFSLYKMVYPEKLPVTRVSEMSS